MDTFQSSCRVSASTEFVSRQRVSDSQKRLPVSCMAMGDVHVIAITKSIALAVLVSASVCAGELYAQTCASPIPFRVPPGGDTATANLCAGTDSVALYCGGLDSAAKNDAIYTVNLPAPGSENRTFTSIVITGSGFTPVIYMYAGACTSGDSCVASGDAQTPIVNDPNIGAGNYFIAVSAAASDAAGACGQYTLSADGNVPVQLQSFSID